MRTTHEVVKVSVFAHEAEPEVGGAGFTWNFDSFKVRKEMEELISMLDPDAYETAVYWIPEVEVDAVIEYAGKNPLPEERDSAVTAVLELRIWDDIIPFYGEQSVLVESVTFVGKRVGA